MANILTVDDSPKHPSDDQGRADAGRHNVIEAGDGAEGLEKAKSNRVDMVITDLNMPVMNGLDLIRELRACPPIGLPIVFLTTESDDAVKQQAKEAGATGWITKPFQQEQLLAVVSKLVRS